MSTIVTNKTNYAAINPNPPKQTGSTKANQGTALKTKAASRVGLEGVSPANNFDNQLAAGIALSPTFAAADGVQSANAQHTAETFIADNVNPLINDILNNSNGQAMLNILSEKMPAVIQKAYKKRISANGAKASTQEMLSELDEACNYLATNTTDTVSGRNNLMFTSSVIELLADILSQLNGQVKAEAGTSAAISSLLTANSSLNAATANAISESAKAEQAIMIAQLKIQLTAAMARVTTEISKMKHENHLHLMIGDIIGAALFIVGLICACCGAVPVGVGLMITGGIQIATSTATGLYENHELSELQKQVNNLKEQINNVASCDDTQALSSFQTSLNSAIDEFAAKMKISNYISAGVQIACSIVITIASMGALAELSVAQIVAVTAFVILPNIVSALGTGLSTYDNNTNVQNIGSNLSSWTNVGSLLGKTINAIDSKADQEEAKQIVVMVFTILTNLVVAFIVGKFIAGSAKTGSISIGSDPEELNSIEMVDMSPDKIGTPATNNTAAVAATATSVNTENTVTQNNAKSNNNLAMGEDIELGEIKSNNNLNSIQNNDNSNTDTEASNTQTQSGLREALKKANEKLNAAYKESPIYKLLSALQGKIGPYNKVVSTFLNILATGVKISSGDIKISYAELGNFYQEVTSANQMYSQLITDENKGDTNTDNSTNQMLKTMLDASNQLINALEQQLGTLAQENTGDIKTTLGIYQKLAGAIN